MDHSATNHPAYFTAVEHLGKNERYGQGQLVEMPVPLTVAEALRHEGIFDDLVPSVHRRRGVFRKAAAAAFMLILGAGMLGFAPAAVGPSALVVGVVALAGVSTSAFNAYRLTDGPARRRGLESLKNAIGREAIQQRWDHVGQYGAVPAPALTHDGVLVDAHSPAVASS